MAGSTPMVCLQDFEKYANDVWSKDVLSFFEGGAMEEVTLKDNVEAFKRWRLRPRCLRDVSQRDMTSTILGHTLSFPVCISPMGLCKPAHPEGEMAVAKACHKAGIGYSLSTFSSTSWQTLSQQVPNGLHFMQLYIFPERSWTIRQIREAEQCGFKGLLVTVDSSVRGRRLAGMRHPIQIPPGMKIDNPYYPKLKDTDGKLDLSQLFSKEETLTWSDIKWVKSITHLPVVVKGVLTGEDGRHAVEAGVDGVFVSNHGGRQLDGVMATIDALPEVVAAVNGQCEVYLDGGVRTGTDVIKALALGAQTVFVGRPALHGLTYNGENGVKEVLGILKEEFSTAMALSGCSSVSEISKELVIHQSQYPSKI